jgi:hypothetical protein
LWSKSEESVAHAGSCLRTKVSTCQHESTCLKSSKSPANHFLAISSDKLDEKTPIPPPDWEALIGEIADDIIKEHSPSQILAVRAKFYDLLTHCIPASTILKTLAFELIKRVDPDVRSEVVTWAAFYEHRIRLGSVSIPKVMRSTLTMTAEGHFPPRSVCRQNHAHPRSVRLPLLRFCRMMLTVLRI